jgi:hypothetical protein
MNGQHEGLNAASCELAQSIGDCRTVGQIDFFDPASDI